MTGAHDPGVVATLADHRGEGRGNFRYLADESREETVPFHQLFTREAKLPAELKVSIGSPVTL